MIIHKYCTSTSAPPLGSFVQLVTVSSILLSSMYPASRGLYPEFFMGAAYLKNRNQINNVGMIGHSSAEDIKLLGGSGHAPQ